MTDEGGGSGIGEGKSIPLWTYWVVPGKFLAGCLPCSPHPGERDRKLAMLLDQGVRTFVNLMELDERDRSGRPFAQYDRAVRALGADRGVEVECLRFPILDLHVPTVAEMETILEALDAALERGTVYLHCWGGVGRTGTVAACWLLKHGYAPGEDVFDHLAELRRLDRMRGHRPSPEMEVQRDFVREWARRLTNAGD